MTRLLFLVALAAGSGCATMHPVAHAQQVRLEPFGEESDVKQRRDDFNAKMIGKFKVKQPGDSVNSGRSVKVFNRALPDGVTVAENGLITATPQSGYQVLGRFAFEPKGATTVAFARYDSVPKTCFCGVNVVLTWLTALAWQAVPISWPCVARAKLPHAEAQGFLRAAAEAAGGDVVVITSREEDENDLFRAEGLILKGPRASAEAPPPPVTTTPAAPEP